MKRTGLGVAALLLGLPACHHQGDAVLLVVVTVSGSPPPVAALEVTLNGPAGSSMNRYTRDGNEPISFPTTLSAQLPARATGMLDVDVRAQDAAGNDVAAGHGDPIMVGPGERKTVYVRLDCDGDRCVVDGGAGDNDGGGTPVGPRCGNGRVDKDETCDTAIPPGDPGGCPPSCDDHIACTRDIRSGSDCTVSCAHSEITDVQQGDGCCPAGKSDKEDRDCPSSSKCGDGTVDPGETCDTAIAPGAPGACPTDDECMAGAPCATALLVSARTCSAVCMRYPIVAQVDGDHCCPAGATHATDGDCPIVCGDGVKEKDLDELCDPGIAPPRPGACPSSCADTKECTTDYLIGFGCQAVCKHVDITAPLSGDGCCPPGANQRIDSDCRPVCGNNVVERGETCDPPASCPTSCPPTPSHCMRAEVVGDADTCTARCVVVDVTDCSLTADDNCCPANCRPDNDLNCQVVASHCGDRLKETTTGEECDIAFPPSDPTACPTSCNDGKACTEDRLLSAGTCAAICMHLPITTFQPGDGCCAFASGANFTLDPDCAPVCGNGIVESPAETCDFFTLMPTCPGADLCPPPMGCTRYVVRGTAGTCSATCVATPITACADGDGCCPAGCSAVDDGDCPVICGDGVVEDGEACDRGITAGAVGACPRSCEDGDACTVDIASGSSEGCTRACLHQPITACISDDGCCPAGCSATSDRDCAPQCGDGHVGAGETCDPPSSCPTSCPDDGDPCTAEQLIGSAAACTAACRHTPITTCASGAGDGCCPTGCTPASDWDCF